MPRLGTSICARARMRMRDRLRGWGWGGGWVFLFLAVLGLRSRAGFSLDAANGGYSLVVACRLLSETASIVAQHGL